MWWEARDFCRDMGGDLAEPSNQAAILAVVSEKFRKYTGPKATVIIIFISSIMHYAVFYNDF